MVEMTKKYIIGTRRFGLINWVGAWTLYKKEVLRFLIVWIQTIFSPLVSSLLFLMVLTLAIGSDRSNVLGVPFITFLALKNISLPEFTTLNMSSPLVGAVLAFFILKEKLNVYIYTSLFL